MGVQESVTELIMVLGSVAIDEIDLTTTKAAERIDPARAVHQNYWGWLFRMGLPPPVRKGSEQPEPKSGIPRRQWIQPIPLHIPQIDEKEFVEAQRHIRKIARQLITKLSRTWRRTKKRKAIAFRPTLRRAISTGGVIVDLRWNTRAIKKPRVVVILDTSGSMDKFVRLLIQLIQAIKIEISDLEFFIFADQLQRVTDDIQSDWRSTISRLEQMSNWGGGTRLQESLGSLLRIHAKVLTRRTVIVLLSDLKTDRLDSCADYFIQIGKRVKRTYVFRAVNKREGDCADIDPEFRKNIEFLGRSVNRIFAVASIEDMVKAVRGLVLK